MPEVEQFRAEGSDGKSYIVRRTPLPTGTATFGRGTASMLGLSRFELKDGRSVNVLPDGRLQIAGTDVFLLRR